MAKQLWEREFDTLGCKSLAAFDSLDRWSPETAEELSDLLRALRRKKGFGLFFVQCSPALGERVIRAIRERFPQKRLERFELNSESETLYFDLQESYQKEAFDIACVTGVEQVLYSYEDAKRLAGWSEEDIYSYSWKGVPSLLSHLNRQREIFEEKLPIALIFLVPRFAIDYLVQRAPDFFDWRSGFFKFVESSESLGKFAQELMDKDYEEYLALTPEQRIEKILEIKDKILQLDSSDCEQNSYLLREQGRLFQSGGDFIRALDCYDRALIANPKNHKALQSKGDTFDDLERYEEAIESYDRVLELDPNNYIVWNSKGMILCDRLQDYNNALKSFERTLEIRPDYYYAWCNKGIVLIEIKRYEESVKSCDCSLKIKRDDDNALFVRGLALSNLERHKEAIESYDRALEIKPDYHNAWCNRGNSLRKLNRNQEAIESYSRALKIKPDYYYAWNVKGLALENLKHYEEAIESYNRAIKIQPDYHAAWYNRGNSLRKLNRNQEAIESYNRALKIKPDYYAWHNRGAALLKLKRYEEAIENYNRALELRPDDHYAWYNHAYVLLKLRRHRQAIESYKKFLYHKPNSEKNWRLNLVAEFYALVDQPSSQRKWWLNLMYVFFTSIGSSKFLWYIAAKIQPKNGIVWNTQGYLTLARYSYGLQYIEGKPLLIRQFQDCSSSQNTTKVNLERCQKALEFFDTALNIDPKENLPWANRSFPTYYLQQYQTALESCNKALELDRENKEEMNEIIYTNRGCIFLQLHNPTAALEDFNTALAIDGTLHKAEAWNGKGTALYQLGRYAEALDSFTEALKLNHPLARTNINLTLDKTSQ